MRGHTISTEPGFGDKVSKRAARGQSPAFRFRLDRLPAPGHTNRDGRNPWRSRERWTATQVLSGPVKVEPSARTRSAAMYRLSPGSASGYLAVAARLGPARPGVDGRLRADHPEHLPETIAGALDLLLEIAGTSVFASIDDQIPHPRRAIKSAVPPRTSTPG